MIMVYLTNNEL